MLPAFIALAHHVEDDPVAARTYTPLAAGLPIAIVPFSILKLVAPWAKVPVPTLQVLGEGRFSVTEVSWFRDVSNVLVIVLPVPFTPQTAMMLFPVESGPKPTGLHARPPSVGAGTVKELQDVPSYEMSRTLAMVVVPLIRTNAPPAENICIKEKDGG
jgi:hypothetical protein